MENDEAQLQFFLLESRVRSMCRHQARDAFQAVFELILRLQWQSRSDALQSHMAHQFTTLA